MTKPRKTDPLPGACRKIKMTGYDCYVSARSGDYRVYPDGRIFMESLEPLNMLLDRKTAARELFELAARHVQQTEEAIAKAMRQWWKDREIDLKKSIEGWSIDHKTGELRPPEEAAQNPTDEV